MEAVLEPIRTREQTLLGCNRILLAEDDADLRSLLAFALESDGYDVLQVEDGTRLTGYLSSQAPIDAVIADVRMPGRSGVEVLSELREVNHSTPFVLITAFGSEELHEKARALGASAVFDKPFDLDDLKTVVRRLVPLAKEAQDEVSSLRRIS